MCHVSLLPEGIFTYLAVTLSVLVLILWLSYLQNSNVETGEDELKSILHTNNSSVLCQKYI
jgi:hypothetical protein